MEVIINELSINYSDNGSGEALLLLHGWGSSIEPFSRIISELSREKGCRVIAIDLPGFGKSQEPDFAWSVDDYASFITEFIKLLNISELSILGHSFGGRIAIKLSSSKELPYKISRVILVDSAGILPKKNAKQKRKASRYKLFKKIVSCGLLSKLFPNALERLKAKHGSKDYLNASPRMRECLVKAVNEDLTPLLPNISVPVLLVWGENDTATPLSDAELMNKLIINSGLVLLKGGHYSFIDQPYVFYKVLCSFMNLSELI